MICTSHKLQLWILTIKKIDLSIISLTLRVQKKISLGES